MKAKIKSSKPKRSRAHREKVEMGSGNVFADLGFEDSEQLLLKAELITRIAQLIERKGWTQAQTAERTALDQPKSPASYAASSQAFQQIASSLSSIE